MGKGTSVNDDCFSFDTGCERCKERGKAEKVALNNEKIEVSKGIEKWTACQVHLAVITSQEAFTFRFIPSKVCAEAKDFLIFVCAAKGCLSSATQLCNGRNLCLGTGQDLSEGEAQDL